MRAIRFATILDFDLDKEVVDAILKTKHLLSNLSYSRKKSELDKIFTSPNFKKGIKLMLDLGLDEDLEIPNLSKVLDSSVSSSIGIWSILNVGDKYPFNKNEIDLIDNVNTVLNTMDALIQLFDNTISVENLAENLQRAFVASPEGENMATKI